MHKLDDVATKLLGMPYESLDEAARTVARHVAKRTHIVRTVVRDVGARPTLGQRAADAVASFGGSWTFVGLFAATMLVWVLLNAFLVMSRGSTFDPYPYILLNLFLSMLAAIQAPIILMSQNRQSERDRISAEHDAWLSPSIPWIEKLPSKLSRGSHADNQPEASARAC